MNKKVWPSISVLMPTLNAASVLDRCLSSIAVQNYPKEKVEIVIADGGSTDRTLEIAKKYGARIFKNPLKTAEAGKATAFHQAKNELVALIDSDNILPDKGWFKRMGEPFLDKEIVGTEPWAYVSRPSDGFIDRYCSLMGMNDPLCYFLGNYDRLNLLSGKWTGLGLKTEDRGDWIKVYLKSPKIPTLGANGAVFRRKFLAESGLVGDYLFDIDILAKMAEKKPVAFAKVKTGMIHLYCGSNIGKFIRKQKRRIKDYLYHEKIGDRKYPWQQQRKIGLLKFVIACVTLLPLIYEAARGYLKKPDRAWIFHPPACWLTLWIYSWSYLQGFWKTEEISRKGWKQ